MFVGVQDISKIDVKGSHTPLVGMPMKNLIDSQQSSGESFCRSRVQNCQGV